MYNEPYINAAGRLVLEYISDDTIGLNLEFINTCGNRLTKGMPYLLVEKKIAGDDINAIRLLNFQHYEEVVYLNVQNLQSGKCFNLSWNMEIHDDGMWFWSLADVKSLSTYKS